MESPTAERKMGTQEPLNLGLCVPLTSKGTDSPEPGVGKCPGSVSAKIETHWGWGGEGVLVISSMTGSRQGLGPLALIPDFASLLTLTSELFNLAKPQFPHQ